MKRKGILWLAVGLLGVLVFIVLAQASETSSKSRSIPVPMSRVAVKEAHVKAPTLQCFDCHGQHPPTDASKINPENFSTKSHAAGPQLTCSDCHNYPKAVEAAVDANSCVGCHLRGGFPIEKAIEALTKEVGHPPVIQLGMVKSVPADCKSCHQGPLSLAPRIHKRHLKLSKLFPLHFQTGCTDCHVFKDDGQVTIKVYPVNPLK